MSEPFFKPEDFYECQCHSLRLTSAVIAANIANRLLRERAQVVYADHKCPGVPYYSEQPFSPADTHRALLLNIERLKKMLGEK